mmetsp:Transcript_7666/g.14114  ORF Transcript_7666/g.14114 Transcript_7666/m.14114 type:complete len:225 (-) Transcript_7666:2430-3104(-)
MDLHDSTVERIRGYFNRYGSQSTLSHLEDVVLREVRDLCLVCDALQVQLEKSKQHVKDTGDELGQVKQSLRETNTLFEEAKRKAHKEMTCLQQKFEREKSKWMDTIEFERERTKRHYEDKNNVIVDSLVEEYKVRLRAESLSMKETFEIMTRHSKSNLRTEMDMEVDQKVQDLTKRFNAKLADYKRRYSADHATQLARYRDEVYRLRNEVDELRAIMRTGRAKT